MKKVKGHWRWIKVKFFLPKDLDKIIFKEGKGMMEEMKQFYNDYPFPNDSIESLNELEAHSWVLKSIPDYISLENKDVCDIGCGTGEIGMYISRKVKSYKGFDFSHNSIHLAKIKSKRLGLKNTSFEVLDITKEHKGKYDMVFCIGVLHHIREKDKAIENIKEMLKPNGILVISVYNKYSCMIGNSNPNEMNKSRYMDTYKNPYETFYTQKGFKKELNRWGFEILGFYRYIPEIVRLFTGRGRMMTFTARLR